MSPDKDGSRFARNVGSITCIKPLEGTPFLALTSQLFIALGLPPDSWFILRRVLFALLGSWPTRARACITIPRHCSTPAPPDGPERREFSELAAEFWTLVTAWPAIPPA